VLLEDKEEDRETRTWGSKRSPTKQAARSRPSRRTRGADAKLWRVVATEGRGSITP
jgi:hypothetical protein